MTFMEPNFTRETDSRVEIESTPDGYRVKPRGGPVLEAGIINIGGRAAAFPAGATLELGGGDTTVIIKEYDDSRSPDEALLAIGFAAEAIL